MDNSCYRIRKMRDGDISQVLDIDLDAFPTQWPHPTKNSFSHELRNKLAHYIVAYKDDGLSQKSPSVKKLGFREVLSYIRGLFAHDRFFGPEPGSTKERLVGMAGIWMMVDEAHIVTIAVRQSHKRTGMGEYMLITLVDLARSLGAKVITLEVRVSNTVAQSLYTKYGFSTAGMRKKYYSDNGEDAFIMSTGDITSPEYIDKFNQLKTEHSKRWEKWYPRSL